MMSRLLVFFVLALLPSAAAEEFRESFASVTPENFDDGGAVSRQFHLNAESYLPMATIPHLGQVHAFDVDLDLHDLLVTLDGELVRFGDYVAEDPLLDGVVVLRGDDLVFEAYTHMQPWQRHFSWSVSKVVTSTALAVLIERGEVDPEQSVDHYVDALKGTAWASISVQNVADMASGIDCLDSDGYQDTSTCVYTMEETLGITASTGRDLDFLTHLQSMEKRGPAGARAEYVSANTNVLMLIMEAVSGTSYANLVSELIWEPIGAEADALIAISSDGYVYASGGVHARLRDIARFGQIYTRPERVGVLSESVISTIQEGGLELDDEGRAWAEDAFPEDPPERTSWQWDFVWSDGAMFKSGYLGQGIFVDPNRDVVIAWFGTGLDYDAETNQMLGLTRQISEALVEIEPAPTP